MKTLEKEDLRIIRNAFAMTKKGKIISSIEVFFIMSIICTTFCCIVILSCGLQCSLHDFKIHIPHIPSFVRNTIIFLIAFFSIIAAAYTYGMGSYYLWRFFKPNKDDIKIYVEAEIKKLTNNVIERGRIIERKKEDLDNLIKQTSEDNKKDSTSIKELTEKFLK